MCSSSIINCLLKDIGIKPGTFAKKVGITPTQVYDLQSGKIKKISENIVDKIREIYPEYNKVWLMTGEGKMKSNPEIQEDVNLDEIANDEYTTWLLPQSAMGGSLSGFASDGVVLRNCEKVISPIKGVDFAISVYGESMAPEYPSGSRVLIKKINPDVFIDWGKVYVLDTSNGVIIKEVIVSPKEGCIRCHSINPDPKYADFDVPMDEVYGMYRVLMCLSAK